MQKHFPIVIIGGGNAGISAAAQLLLKDNSLNIAIVEPSEKHYYQPAWTLVGGGVFNIKDTEHQQIDQIPEKATWIRDSASIFRPESNEVECASGLVLTYDYLIVAPGIQLDWHKIKGAKETLGKNGVCTNYQFDQAPYTWKFAQEFVAKGGGKAIFTSPNTPVKCGGAPQKIMYLLSDYFRKKKVLKQSKVHFYSGGSIIFGVKKYADTLNRVLKRYDIQTHFLHNCIAVDGERKLAWFETRSASGELKVIEESFDFIHLTPPQSAPDFIKNSPLAIPDPAAGPEGHSPQFLGWIDVDKHTLQHSHYSNIFACGDATNTPNAKTGAAVRKQVPVMVSNILSLMKGQPMSASYNGYGSCPLITGYGKLVLAEFDYTNTPTETFPIDQSKERWSMYMLKRWVLPWMYWHKILKGKA
ncbi:MAG: NAD(P)/FAD-dependent oxidoreductase [Chitinophagaceae bacterium]|nr:NAD(P)/FAD-dependent oxidoreductase [Chitinophagaceae bacterium]